MLWCIVGVLLNPSKMAPYASAVVCFLAHATSVFSSLRANQLGVQRTVRRRVALHSARLQGWVSPTVLDVILNKNTDQALHDAGYSLSKVFFHSLIQPPSPQYNNPVSGGPLFDIFVLGAAAC
jgi:hypothetical protein